MEYNGVIKQSRTLDVLALMGVMESVILAAQNELANLGFDTQMQSILRIVFIGVLAVLRFKTTGPVGDKQ